MTIAGRALMKLVTNKASFSCIDEFSFWIIMQIIFLERIPTPLPTTQYFPIHFHLPIRYRTNDFITTNVSTQLRGTRTL